MTRAFLHFGVTRPIPSQYLDPISNVNTLWSTNSYTGIDDGIRQPSTGFVGSCNANKNDDNEAQQWGVALGTTGTYSIAYLWAYGYRLNTAGDPLGNMIFNGSSQTQQQLNFGVGASNAGWHSISFSGPFTLPATTLTMEITSGNHPGFSDSLIVSAAYLEFVP